MKFTKDEVATIAGVLREQADRRRRESGTAMACGCRNEAACALCRPVEELDAIVKKCDDELWHMDRAGIFTAWRKVGHRHPSDRE